ncbi:hypothetical protein [Synechococcus sp. RSCCF101]|uniref:hypothetical protein n=1 Tax=Synechococcus sp. RSCCF101 TaxID=2511069 RepID=UPI00177F1C7C|nr:hypothetical protein [Synechococcus sp. RSCCF101]
MHTHDLENHDNLYADEVTMAFGETAADADRHAWMAIGAISLTVLLLGAAGAVANILG